MRSFRALACLLLVSIAFTGCKKKVFDYRNKFTGNYDIDYTVSWWDIQGNSGTTNLKLKGYIARDEHDKKKIVLHCNGENFSVEADKKGNLYLCGDKNGEFDKKHESFSFTYYQCGPGGHGGSGMWKFKGKKR